MAPAAVLLCAIVTCLVGAGPLLAVPTLEGRIVGGSNAAIKDFPYQLSLHLLDNHICSSAVISRIWAVTAANCVRGSPANDFHLRAGTGQLGYGGSYHEVAQVIIHSGYDPITTDYNIAVLRVYNAFPDTAVPVTLPAQNEAINDKISYTVIGWGKFDTSNGGYPSVLQKTTQTYIPHGDCKTGEDVKLTDRMICAGDLTATKGPCTRDEGGPLVAGNKMVGLVAYAEECGYYKYPAIYTRVSALRAWIEGNTGV